MGAAEEDPGTTTELAPGEHLAVIRKAHGLTRSRLAGRAGIPLSLLSAIEAGNRVLTPSVAASVGWAMGLGMSDVLGKATVAKNEARALTELRAALRDYDLPETGAAAEGRFGDDLATARRYRRKFDVSRLLGVLPTLLRGATAHAHTVNTATAWSDLSEVYSTVYWLAARYRWTDLAELAVTRQRWAVEQRPTPMAAAVAARDRAGTYLNFGDAGRGLDVVDRAIAEAQRDLSGTERDLAVCILNLRGMTLAGRLPDREEAGREADRHIRSAMAVADGLGSRDSTVLGLTAGPQNTVLHRLATYVDLGRPQEAMALVDMLPAALDGLPATRVAPTHVSMARAQLDLGELDMALRNLAIACDAAPQIACIDPWFRETLRVVSSLHRRSNPELVRLARLAGMSL
ncbi:helix-turn-helix domain-containing protein [Streptomyces yaizuensis]|uniref:Helix-turn-helix domain-containing protein n=1 Tax=Streptomyces yaizuensis TaxID=2989713 RepID=A0ABQ5NZN2_9ACTN|nr:helix-turn-helix domain-containing protein [Streptomyces sp. YSPA8]GLF95816.1 helix-turn-helix domain-containing protein [Streptomyces sp. YSPA8]